MRSKRFSLRGQLVKRVAPVCVAAAALAFSATGVSAQSCQPLVGHYVEHAVAGPDCTSPVGLCIAGEYSGVLKGEFDGTATSLVPTADTPTTGVLLFTSESVIHASLGGKQGDLHIKNAGVFRNTGKGDILDLQFITGGEGELAGATGIIHANGFFDPASGSGESEYTGTLCLP